MAEDKKKKAETPNVEDKKKEAEVPATTPAEKVDVDIDALVAEKVAAALAEAKAAEVAEAEAKEKAMTAAEAELLKEQQEYANELVPCFLHYVDGEPEEVTVGFGAKLYKIQKGEEVMVPRFIYEILVRSGKQQLKAKKKQEELANVELNA